MFVTSTKDINRKSAKQLCSAIRKFSEHPENLENFQLYLEHHFEEWLEKYANTPESIAYEIECFATMEG